MAIDRERIQQVVRNIFENALAACADPVLLAVGIEERAQDGQPIISVTIRDNGPGIPAEQLPRVFDPFFTTKPKGTGLGLAIARRVIESHGGQIDVSSPGGAEFRMNFPG